MPISEKEVRTLARGSYGGGGSSLALVDALRYGVLSVTVSLAALPGRPRDNRRLHPVPALALSVLGIGILDWRHFRNAAQALSGSPSIQCAGFTGRRYAMARS